MRITMLAAGAAGMYCGSCMRDNAAAGALMAAGHDVLLLPLYTPLRVDEQYVGSEQVFYGAVNVFLEHSVRFLRRMPAGLHRLLNRPKLLAWVGRFAGSTTPAQLGALTVDVLRGRRGNEAAELELLLGFLEGQGRPDVVHLPNLLFLGVAGPLRRLGAPLVCTLSGEDGFVEGLPQPHRDRALELIAKGAGHVDAFVATSRWLAERSIEVFGLPADRVHTIWTGIHGADLAREKGSDAEKVSDTPSEPLPRNAWVSDTFSASDPAAPRVGYLARICPAKGLDLLMEAFPLVLAREGLADATLHVAGYLGPADRKWFDGLRGRAGRQGWAERFVYHGEVDRRRKADFLASLHCFSVPTRHPEAKGISVLEAMAARVPVAQPEHGCFPELLADTGGGVLVRPHDPAALADAIAGLLLDRPRAEGLAAAGQAAVQARYTPARMAEALAALYASL